MNSEAFLRNHPSFRQEQDNNTVPIAKIFVISLIFSLAISCFFAQQYYDDDIHTLEKAYRDEIKLYPATQLEKDFWEFKDKQIQAEVKRKEIEYLKAGLTPPDNIDEDIIDKHYDNYPSGHNPPKEQLQEQLDKAYFERKKLMADAIIGSFILSLTITGISFLQKKT